MELFRELERVPGYALCRPRFSIEREIVQFKVAEEGTIPYKALFKHLIFTHQVKFQSKKYIEMIFLIAKDYS